MRHGAYFAVTAPACTTTAPAKTQVNWALADLAPDLQTRVSRFPLGLIQYKSPISLTTKEMCAWAKRAMPKRGAWGPAGKGFVASALLYPAPNTCGRI